MRENLRTAVEELLLITIPLYSLLPHNSQKIMYMSVPLLTKGHVTLIFA